MRKHIHTVHEGHKDHKCESCGKSFTSAKDLAYYIHWRDIQSYIKYKCFIDNEI